MESVQNFAVILNHENIKDVIFNNSRKIAHAVDGVNPSVYD